MVEQLGFEPEEAVQYTPVASEKESQDAETVPPTSDITADILEDMRSVMDMPVEDLEEIFNLPFIQSTFYGRSNWRINLRTYYKKLMAKLRNVISREYGMTRDLDHFFWNINKTRGATPKDVGGLVYQRSGIEFNNRNIPLIADYVPNNESKEYSRAVRAGNDYLKQYAAETLSLLRPADPPESETLLRPHEATSGDDNPDELLRPSDQPEDEVKNE